MSALVTDGERRPMPSTSQTMSRVVKDESERSNSRYAGLPTLNTSSHPRYDSPLNDPPPPPPAAYAAPPDEGTSLRSVIPQKRGSQHESYIDEPIPPPPAKYSYPLPSISEALNMRGEQPGAPNAKPTEIPPSFRRYSNDTQSSDRYTQSREYEAQRGPMSTPYSSAAVPTTPATASSTAYQRRPSFDRSYQGRPHIEPQSRTSHAQSSHQDQWRSNYQPPQHEREQYSQISRHTPYAPSTPAREAMPPPSGPTVSTIYAPSLSNPHTPSTGPNSAGYAPLQSSTVYDDDLKKPGKPIYGDSVKRHLDTYDLEQSLNTMGESSRELLEFSEYYRQKAHNTQRTGPLPGTTPHLQQIDDMMKHGSRIQEALNRLREVVVTQQAEIAVQDREKASRLASVELQQQDDAKVDRGFSSGDSKKRRGRAAPPGKCHSCNRVDTPEWRRGPDGARTLCNACGLHFAKLNRKSVAGKAAQGDSNLKPRDGSPAAA